jgi:carbamoyltransferase
MKILGISAFYHDSAAALLVDGHIVAAAQEERFSRKKGDAGFPLESVRYCLQQSGLSIDDLDALVFYDKSFLKFERLLETYLHFAPLGFLSFFKAIPLWIKQKMLVKRHIRQALTEVGCYDKKKLKLLFSTHHLSHAASAWYLSGFDKAAILTLDGVGEWATASIGKGEGHQIQMFEEMHFPHSVGLFYSSFTSFLGFKVNSGEYKMMGLAPYGNPQGERTAAYRDLILNRMISIMDDGSIRMNMRYFSYPHALRMIPLRRWERLFELKSPREGEEHAAAHCDLALAVQQVTEEIILKMAKHAVAITGCDKLCMAGGVALNCVANAHLLKSGIVSGLFIQPAAGDAGAAAGAALAAFHMYFEKEDHPEHSDPFSCYLGPDIHPDEIEFLKNTYGAVSRKIPGEAELVAMLAKELAKGKIAGWVQGRMEFGPRALGNRSILADPGNTEMQKKLNLSIKFREGFRPFAPSVTEEDASEYFDIPVNSPYMLLVAPLREKYRHKLPENYAEIDLRTKLYTPRSSLQAITHVDFSARLHTVSKKENPRFHTLLKAFEKESSYPVLVNTSFNVRGEPIVCSAHDAYRCFMNTDMDLLVIENDVFIKEEQPDYQNKNRWKMKFKMD